MLISFLADVAAQDIFSPVGSPMVLQRRGSVYGANVPMITELGNVMYKDSDILLPQLMNLRFHNVDVKKIILK